MARTGRAKPMTAKAGVTKTKRRYVVNAVPQEKGCNL